MTCSSRTSRRLSKKVRACMPSRPGKEARFLILRLSSFGDIVLAEPVARRLKETYPACHLSFGTFDEYGGIPSLFPCVDSVVGYSRDLMAIEPNDSQEVRFDAVIDLQSNLKSRRIIRGLRARRVLRYRRQHIRRFLAVYLPQVWKGKLKHTSELYFDAIRRLGAGPSDSFPRLRVPGEIVEDSAARFGGGPFIGICPGASSRFKMWGVDRFRELIKLLRDQGHGMLVIGSNQDRAMVESTMTGITGGASAYVGSDIARLAGLLSLCQLTVGNDSGLLHLAAAVGSRVISMFGPTSPILGFAPLAPGNVAVTRGLACSPCSYHGNRPCRYERMLCMEDIEPSEVASIVNDLALRNPRR